MNTIEELRSKVEGEIITSELLSKLYGDGPSRYNKVLRLVQSGRILKIRGGLYAFGELYRKGSISEYEVGNLLLKGSYVSFDSALSYHGMIPEAVRTITSANSKRSFVLRTNLGNYEYRQIPLKASKVGILRVGITKVKIADPEKALLDKIYLDFKKKDTLDYLLESLRIEEEDLLNLSKKVLLRYAAKYENTSFYTRISKGLVKRLA